VLYWFLTTSFGAAVWLSHSMLIKENHGYKNTIVRAYNNEKKINEISVTLCSLLCFSTFFEAGFVDITKLMPSFSLTAKSPTMCFKDSNKSNVIYMSWLSISLVQDHKHGIVREFLCCYMTFWIVIHLCLTSLMVWMIGAVTSNQVLHCLKIWM
jgi:hypothetical protein